MKLSNLLGLALFSLLLVSLVSASNNQLEVTNNHPFLINNTWIQASQLQVGDLLTTIDGKHARITGIEDVFANVSVYNLEDEFLHNYVAGWDNIVVHNSNKPGIMGGVGKGVTDFWVDGTGELVIAGKSPIKAIAVKKMNLEEITAELANKITGTEEEATIRAIMNKEILSVDFSDGSKIIGRRGINDLEAELLYKAQPDLAKKFGIVEKHQTLSGGVVKTFYDGTGIAHAAQHSSDFNGVENFVSAISETASERAYSYGSRNIGNTLVLKQNDNAITKLVLTDMPNNEYDFVTIYNSYLDRGFKDPKSFINNLQADVRSTAGQICTLDKGPSRIYPFINEKGDWLIFFGEDGGSVFFEITKGKIIGRPEMKLGLGWEPVRAAKEIEKFSISKICGEPCVLDINLNP